MYCDWYCVVEATGRSRLEMPPLYGFIKKATKRWSGRVRYSPVAVFSVGDSAGNCHVEMTKIIKEIRRRNDFFHVHFERDEVDVYRRAKLLKKFAGKKNYICRKLKNKKSGWEFEKNLSKAIDLYYDWSEIEDEEIPHIIEKLSSRKSSIGIFIIGSGGHSPSSIYLARKIIESYEFSHTICLVVEPENTDKKSRAIYEKLISYLDKAHIFETHVVMPSKSLDGKFQGQDSENTMSILSHIQKNMPDNVGHLCSKKWWRLGTETTRNPFYKTMFSVKHHVEGAFEVLATTIDKLNENGMIDENSIYTFSGDLVREEIQDAISKISSRKRQHFNPEIRQLLIKIRKRQNLVIGRFIPVNLKKFTDCPEFTELEYLMTRKDDGNEYYG